MSFRHRICECTLRSTAGRDQSAAWSRIIFGRRQIKSREDWERFRDTRIAALKKSFGSFPPPKPPLQARVTARHDGDGYRLENVVFQVRPQYWMAANLYLPAKAPTPIPAILIVH